MALEDLAMLSKVLSDSKDGAATLYIGNGMRERCVSPGPHGTKSHISTVQYIVKSAVE